MILHLLRTTYTARSTIGTLTADGVPECDTLEDVRRPDGAPKVPGATAIPPGRYRVTHPVSRRFGQPMPHLADVPGFGGILIHYGNSPADTEGCILVGTAGERPDWIGSSRAAFAPLEAKIAAALAVGEQVWITVEDDDAHR